MVVPRCLIQLLFRVMRRELLGCGLSEDGQLGLGSRSAACVKLPEQIGVFTLQFFKKY